MPAYPTPAPPPLAGRTACRPAARTRPTTTNWPTAAAPSARRRWRPNPPPGRLGRPSPRPGSSTMLPAPPVGSPRPVVGHRGGRGGGRVRGAPGAAFDLGPGAGGARGVGGPPAAVLGARRGTAAAGGRARVGRAVHGRRGVLEVLDPPG